MLCRKLVAHEYLQPARYVDSLVVSISCVRFEKKEKLTIGWLATSLATAATKLVGEASAMQKSVLPLIGAMAIGGDCFWANNWSLLPSSAPRWPD